MLRDNKIRRSVNNQVIVMTNTDLYFDESNSYFSRLKIKSCQHNVEKKYVLAPFKIIFRAFDRARKRIGFPNQKTQRGFNLNNEFSPYLHLKNNLIRSTFFTVTMKIKFIILTNLKVVQTFP